MSLLRSISGLRATLGNSLTPDVVARHAVAFAQHCKNATIVVGRDGRPSGMWIEDIVVGALRACGCTVRVLGMVPTPTVQLDVEHSNAAGGIVITASHNPEEWNGLKFIGADGVFLSPQECTALWSLADSPVQSLPRQQQAGRVERNEHAIAMHLERVLELEAVSSAPKTTGGTVVVDAVNSSGSDIIPMLLERMGYSVVRLFCDGTGIFPHTPEPIAENLVLLGEAVRQHHADFGVAVDPDADRLVLVDDSGKPIGEEYTVTLAIWRVLQYMQQGSVGLANRSVAVNYSTTRMVDDVAERYGVNVYRSAVGEVNVVRCMQQNNAVIGGEGSGGVIYPTCHNGRDSVVALALITSLLRVSSYTLREGCDAIPRYSMIKTKIPLQGIPDITQSLADYATTIPDATVSRDDGIHAAWNDRWIHIRTSNTEPIARIIAEAPTSQTAEQVIAEARRILGVV